MKGFGSFRPSTVVARVGMMQKVQNVHGIKEAATGSRRVIEMNDHPADASGFLHPHSI
jgi:hypothetical protein